MAFDEIQLPKTYSYGAAGGPGFATYIGTGDSGQEERVVLWEHGRIRYDLSYDVQSPEKWGELLAFYRARQGAARGFRFHDASDYTSAADGVSDPATSDQQLGIGDGSQTTFQLVKTYDDGLRSVTRSIHKPVAGSVVVEVGGVAQVSPGWSNPWSVDTTTGIVTFTTPPGVGDAVAAGFEFDVPARFADSIDDLLAVRLDGFQVGSVDLEIVELLNPSALGDEPAAGGSQSYGNITGATVQLSPASGRVLIFAPTGANKVRLPNPAGMPLGGPWFYLINQGGVSLTIETHTGASIGSVPAAGTSQALLLSGPTWALL